MRPITKVPMMISPPPTYSAILSTVESSVMSCHLLSR
jgi:hypothetical protein